ncbi:MAG: hypothetical protein ACRDGQ_07065, partial [Candidatus Limnocylindrales bacterium]
MSLDAKAAAALVRRPGHQLAAGLRTGEFSALEVTEAHLAGAERDNHGLNAWLTLDVERARAEAMAADARLITARREGPEAVAALPAMH